MRALILASVAAAAFATPAFADTSSVTANYTFFVADSCTFTDDSASKAITYGTDDVIEVTIECNVPFDVSLVDGTSATGTDEDTVTMTNQDLAAGDVLASDYNIEFVAPVNEATTMATHGGSPSSFEYRAQDGIISYTIDWDNAANGAGVGVAGTTGIAAGNYTGAATIVLTGDDVSAALG